MKHWNTWGLFTLSKIRNSSQVVIFYQGEKTDQEKVHKLRMLMHLALGN